MTMVDRQPAGELQVRTVAMPADTNPSGDIFGGWVLSQMDIAAGTAAAHRARGRCATVAIDAMSFHAPVHVGDILSCYAKEERIGRSSLTFKVEAWTIRAPDPTGNRILVTEGTFVFVALDNKGKPREVQT
jgi:acyl-CoA thioesterase YciA